MCLIKCVRHHFDFEARAHQELLNRFHSKTSAPMSGDAPIKALINQSYKLRTAVALIAIATLAALAIAFAVVGVGTTAAFLASPVGIGVCATVGILLLGTGLAAAYKKHRFNITVEQTIQKYPPTTDDDDDYDEKVEYTD